MGFLTSLLVWRLNTLALELLKGAWLSSSCFELISLSKEVEIRMFAQHTQKLLFRPGWNTLWISVNLHTQLCQDWVSSVLYRSKSLYAVTTMFIESSWAMLIWTHFKLLVGLVSERGKLWTVVASFVNHPWFCWAFNMGNLPVLEARVPAVGHLTRIVEWRC